MNLAARLTVCICTRNRPDALSIALDSVAAHAPQASVIVSDDGEGTAARVVDGRPNCRWQRGPRRGLGANRNAAVDSAQTDWVLFLDDDATLGETFVVAVEECLSGLEHQVRTRTIVTGKEVNQGRLVEPRDVDFLGFQTREYGPGEELHTVVINSAVWPRALFDRVRFDETLLYGSDEVDLSYSALAAGYRIQPCWAAMNHHKPDPRGRDGYALNTHVSRLRATTKRYWRLRRRRGRAVLFLVLAPLHLLKAMLGRRGPRGIGSWARIMRRWLTS